MLRGSGEVKTSLILNTEEYCIAYTFPELRCTFAGCSIVLDIAVLRWGDNLVTLDAVLLKLRKCLKPSLKAFSAQPQQSIQEKTLQNASSRFHKLKLIC
jgi:hypothetical protein